MTQGTSCSICPTHHLWYLLPCLQLHIGFPFWNLLYNKMIRGAASQLSRTDPWALFLTLDFPFSAINTEILICLWNPLTSFYSQWHFTTYSDILSSLSNTTLISTNYGMVFLCNRPWSPIMYPIKAKEMFLKIKSVDEDPLLKSLPQSPYCV